MTFSTRYLNEGFSGGEKKRMEILQLALQEPQLAILDETDSGLDIDALRVVANGVNAVAGPGMGVLIITHYQRILHLVQPSHVHVIYQGRIVKRGRSRAGRRAREAGLRMDSRGGGGPRRGARGAARRRGRDPRMSTTAALPDLTAEFPVLRRKVAGHPLVYLDSAATSQTPQPVIDAMTSYYTELRASVHRGVYPLAVEATDLYEGARRKIADWLRSTAQETIFTANATAAINLVAYSWGRQNVQRGDLVVITEMEHHSNIVPWQLLVSGPGG